MNRKAKSDIFKAISLQKHMMELTGCWPKRNPNIAYKLKNYIITGPYIAVSFLVFLEVCYTFMQEDYKGLTEVLSFFASATSYVPKLLMLMYKSSKFLDMLQDLKDEKFHLYPLEFDRHVKRANKFIHMLIRFYQIIVFSFVLILFLKPFYTEGEAAIRITFYDMGPWIIVYHIFQVVVIGFGCYNAVCLDTLIIGLIFLGTAQLKILRDKLVNIRTFAGFTYGEVDNGNFNTSEDFNEETDANIEVRIKECVEHHLAIIKFLDGIEDIFTYTFFVQFFSSVLAICNTWFQFQLTEEWVKLAYLSLYSAALCTQLGIYCIFGDNLMHTSLELQDACYNSEWYKCGPKVRSSLMIIKERTKRPVILTAGKFMTLSLITYTALLRTSYSYFALMNQFNKN